MDLVMQKFLPPRELRYRLAKREFGGRFHWGRGKARWILCAGHAGKGDLSIYAKGKEEWRNGVRIPCSQDQGEKIAVGFVKKKGLRFDIWGKKGTSAPRKKGTKIVFKGNRKKRPAAMRSEEWVL